uniref:XPGN domain-containing protein n=1 Tax=Trichobilharzia regenti TaxID=157069 RepID=A0AA85JH83_TRIRE|nr:unnamed protein product [Trichobilharzia regenti]
MGVPGLWRLLEPAREPIDLQQLSGKIVAIDMNIWLHQAVKSRGASGGPRNYLAIFFRRLCKLLFFGIRPVFVFDGDTPALKRATIHTRRQLRNSAEAKAEKAQKHLLRRLLRRVAESEVGSSNVSTNGTQPPENLAKEELLRRLKQQSNFLQAMEDAEIFSAPSNQSISSDNKGSGIMLSENAGLEYDELARDFLDGFYSSDRKLSGMDLNSDAFCSLPLPAQLRVVQLAREILDTSSCRRDLIQRNNEASFDPETFSDVQTKRLLLRRRLAERQQELSDNLTKQEAVQQVLQLDNSMIKNILKNQSLCSALSTESTETIATAMRIQSQDVGHAILLKQSPLKKSNSLSKLPSSTTFDLEKLIALNPIELNASINNEEVECTKEASSLDASLDGTKDLKKVSNVELPSNDVCSPKQLQIPVNEQNIIEESITDSKCYSFDEQSTISESLNKKQMEDESEKEANISDNFNKVDQTIIINNNNSSENVLVVSASQDSFSLETEKLPIKPESPVFESLLCDHNNIRRDESNLNSNLSQQIHEVDDVKDFEDTQQNNEMNSDEDDDDDDFIEVETHEHVDLSNISSESTILQKYSTDKSSSHEESESTYTHEESESFDKETVEDSNIKEYISSSDLEDDDLIVDDNMLREKADRLTRQAQSTTTRCISEAQDLLRLFGFPFVVSPEEAEAQCVALQRYGLVDLVASDDSDVWPFGVRLVCRHLFGTGDDKKRRTNPSLYKLDEVKRKLGHLYFNYICLRQVCCDWLLNQSCSYFPTTNICDIPIDVKCCLPFLASLLSPQTYDSMVSRYERWSGDCGLKPFLFFLEHVVCKVVSLTLIQLKS